MKTQIGSQSVHNRKDAGFEKPARTEQMPADFPAVFTLLINVNFKNKAFPFCKEMELRSNDGICTKNK